MTNPANLWQYATQRAVSEGQTPAYMVEQRQQGETLPRMF